MTPENRERLTKLWQWVFEIRAALDQAGQAVPEAMLDHVIARRH